LDDVLELPDRPLYTRARTASTASSAATPTPVVGPPA
jgi:hypothetical protein